MTSSPAEQMAPLFFAQSPDAIIFADLSGAIRACNPAAAAMFGFSADEALGQSLDRIIPERFRDAHWRGYRQALAVGATKYEGKALPTLAQKAGGETFYVELSFAVVRDEDGTVIGALAHGREITARFEEDRVRRRRLRELEEQVAAYEAAAAGAGAPE